MLSHDQALLLLKKYIKTENTIKHMIALSAVMAALAEKLEPDKKEEWLMAGLLHDIDYEQDLGENSQKHGELSVEILRKEGVFLPESVYSAIKAHCYGINSDYQPKNKMEWAIFIADSLTGLIVATALVRPDKKLKSVEVKSILKKFKEKSFAAGTRREDIKLCQEKLDIPLPEFVGIALKAMQGVSEELGL
jgi:putative nucleotidyltransferase with HDIG domain